MNFIAHLQKWVYKRSIWEQRTKHTDYSDLCLRNPYTDGLVYDKGAYKWVYGYVMSVEKCFSLQWALSRSVKCWEEFFTAQECFEGCVWSVRKIEVNYQNHHYKITRYLAYSDWHCMFLSVCWLQRVWLECHSSNELSWTFSLLLHLF